MKKILSKKVMVSLVGLMLIISIGSSCTTSKKYGCPGSIVANIAMSVLG